MWIKPQHFDEIKSALKEGQPLLIDQALAQILTVDEPGTDVPSDCPQCHKELIRAPLPYLEVFVSTCPDHHGVWMSPSVWKQLKELMSTRAAADDKKKFILKVLSQVMLILIIGFSGMIFLVYGPKAISDFMKEKNIQGHFEKISEDYWPIRPPSDFPALPIKESTVNDADDLLYLDRFASLLETAVSNRLNMDGALRVSRSVDSYHRVYQFFVTKQAESLKELRALTPPEKFVGFHDLLLQAIEEQIDFYGDFTAAKQKSSLVSLNQFLTHPALKSSSSKLHRAYGIFKETYPDVDKDTNEAVERRLCWMDII